MSIQNWCGRGPLAGYCPSPGICDAIGCQHVLRSNQKETKMTRSEAIKKFETASSGGTTAELWLDRFEALGLIKFDEEKMERTAEEIILSSHQSNIIKNLNEAGYRIVKLGMVVTTWKDGSWKKGELEDIKEA